MARLAGRYHLAAMDLSPAAIIDRFRGKAFRYLAVSVIGTIITQAQICSYVNQLDWNDPRWPTSSP